MRALLLTALLLSTPLASAQDLETPCTPEQLHVEKQCLDIIETRWRIVEQEHSFEVELRPDHTLLSSHTLATWPQNDSWRVEGDVLYLSFQGTEFAFRIQAHASEQVSGRTWKVTRAEALDPSARPEGQPFQAVTTAAITRNEQAILTAYEDLTTLLHPMAASSIHSQRAILKRVEDLTAAIDATDNDCAKLASALQTFTRDGAPGLALQLKDSQGFEGLSDLTNPLDPDTNTVDDHLADAKVAKNNKRLIAAHKSIYASTKACSMQSEVAEGFANLVAALH